MCWLSIRFLDDQLERHSHEIKRQFDLIRHHDAGLRERKRHAAEIEVDRKRTLVAVDLAILDLHDITLGPGVRTRQRLAVCLEGNEICAGPFGESITPVPVPSTAARTEVVDLSTQV